MTHHDDWARMIAHASDQNDKTALKRLAGRARKFGVSPFMIVADRDHLYQAMQAVKAKKPEDIINRGLKALANVAVEHPDLGLPTVALLPTRWVVIKAENAALGSVFNEELEKFLKEFAAPVDSTGRKRPARDAQAKRERRSILQAARIVKGSGLSTANLRSILTAEARDRVVRFFGDPGRYSGGRNKLLNSLLLLARELGEPDDAIALQLKNLRTHKNKMKAASISSHQQQAPYHYTEVRDELLEDIAEHALLTNGWPEEKGLRQTQTSLSGLFSYYAKATPQFIDSLRFKGADKATPWGSRPTLISTIYEHEDVEAHFPQKLVTLIDIYWGEMPDALRKTGRVFMYADGSPLSNGMITSRLNARLRELRSGLTPLNLVDLAAQDMIWDDVMTEKEMAIAMRFCEQRAFVLRYRRMIENITTLRHKNNGKRPDQPAKPWRRINDNNNPTPNV
jgi:hypothetical protein